MSFFWFPNHFVWYSPFLSNLNYEWLDSFKQDVADAIIETLINFAESFDFKTDPDFILHLCDCIFNLPCYGEFTREEQEKVVKILR